MLELRVEIDGLEELQLNMRRISDRGVQNIEDALDLSAHHLRDEIIKDILQGEKTGRTYVRRSVVHRASAPGEAPASDTGNLVANIAADRSRLPQLDAGVVSEAPYSQALEYGTRNMEERPFMRPALLRTEEAIVERVREAVDRALRQGRRGR